MALTFRFAALVVFRHWLMKLPGLEMTLGSMFEIWSRTSLSSCCCAADDAIS